MPSRNRRSENRRGPRDSDGSTESARHRKIALLGGGNGISVVLRGLVREVRRGASLDLVAIVATADDGGSSGRLRRERGAIPPGDLRNCLLALSDGGKRSFIRLFGHRYDGEGALAGHALGNLILLALAERFGDYVRALDEAGRMLGARGRVLPVSLEPVRLEAEARDGVRISGESRIGRSHCAVHRIWLDPPAVRPTDGVLDAVRNADLVVLGPGSLFTSLLAVLLVPGVAHAVRESRGRRVLVANLMTQPGETVGMGLHEHLEALDRHVGPGVVDSVVVHDAGYPTDRVRPYREQDSEPVSLDGLEDRPERIVASDLITRSGKIRHDPRALARLLLRLDLGQPDVGTRVARSA